MKILEREGKAHNFKYHLNWDSESEIYGIVFQRTMYIVQTTVNELDF